MLASPVVLCSLISIISLIGSINAQFTRTNHEVNLNLCGMKYIYSPLFPSNYPPGITHTWTIRSMSLHQLVCEVMELSMSDVLTVQRDVYDPGVRIYSNYKLDLNARTQTLYITLRSNGRPSNARFRCLVTSTCVCGWTNPARISGGEETGVNEFPMMAGLVDADAAAMPYKGVYCGATIINYKQVITAAHCLDGKNTDRVGVLVGDHNLPQATETDAAQLFRIDTVVVHPYYNKNENTYDIAMITINGVIAMSFKVGPVCLPFQYSQQLFENEPVTLLGWGSVGYSEERSLFLQKAHVHVTSNAHCQSEYNQKAINNYQICTLDPVKDSCQYDSGGPVLWRDRSTKRLFLVGIISWGSICGNNQSTINTRVSSYLNWIESLKPPDYFYYKGL